MTDILCFWHLNTKTVFSSMILGVILYCQHCINHETTATTPGKEDSLCILVMFAHWPDPLLLYRGQKGALWCDKWFADLQDINKWFIQDSEQEVPSDFKQALWKKQQPEVHFSPVSVFCHWLWLSGTNGQRLTGIGRGFFPLFPH